MFEHELKDEGYYILMDKLKGKFGPFKGIFVKNQYLGNINKCSVDEVKYPGYKYSIGISNSSVFIIGKDKQVEIVKN